MATFRGALGLRTWTGRSLLVRKVLQQWQTGLPIRTAAKILRKAGIHPWSLAAHAPFRDRDRLARELRLPQFIQAACHHFSGQGFHFQHVTGALSLPNGLVLEQVSLHSCPDIRQLPRILWAQSVRVVKCDQIESLSHRGGQSSKVRGEYCPRLNQVAFSMDEEGDLALVGCPGIRNLPSIRRPRNLTLKDLPAIRTIGLVTGVVRLSLWRLPSLLNLSGTKVSLDLVIQDCPNLWWLRWLLIYTRL